TSRRGPVAAGDQRRAVGRCSRRQAPRRLVGTAGSCMATMMRTIIAIALGSAPAALAGGCSNISGFGGAVPALASVSVQATGDFASVQAPRSPDPMLRAALVWGAQWLPEPLCI